MRNFPTFTSKGQKNRGSVLLVTFFLCMIAGLSALFMVSTLMDTQRTNQRQKGIINAYFVAEAGVHQVMHWGNFPEQYDGLGVNGLFFRDMITGEFPRLSTATMTMEISIPADKLRTMTSKYGKEFGSVTEITLVPADPAVDPVNALFKVRTEGKTTEGSTRNILAYLYPNPLDSTDIKLPAALISMASAGLGGNAIVHWGPSWSKTNFNFMNNSQAGHLDQSSASYDPWAKYVTEGQILFPPNWKNGVGKDIFDPGARQFPGTAPASGDYANAFHQFAPSGTIDWPDFLSEYDTFKDMAKAHGRYYSTDPAGNIYRDGVEDEAHKVDFVAEFEKADRQNSYYDLVFIDTTDKSFPAADGSNLATISSSGTGTGLKGVFWVGAHFDQTGVGTPPTLTAAEKPDGSTEDLAKIYLDGVMYTAGSIALGGNAGVYGCIYAERGFAGGGTPNIYYNHRLENGLELPKGNVGSTFRIVLQKNY